MRRVLIDQSLSKILVRSSHVDLPAYGSRAACTVCLLSTCSMNGYIYVCLMNVNIDRIYVKSSPPTLFKPSHKLQQRTVYKDDFTTQSRDVSIMPKEQMGSGEPVDGEKDGHVRNIVKHEHGHHAHGYAKEVDAPRKEAFGPHEALEALPQRLVRG